MNVRTKVRLILLCALPISCAAPSGKVATSPILFEILSTASVPFAVDASDQIASMGASLTWQSVDANGRLIRRSEPGGFMTEICLPRQLQQIWTEKGLQIR